MDIEKIIYKEALKAYKKEEIPVGCVITRNGEVISRAHNTRQSKHSCINHAEILAILKAEKKLKDWRLDGCELYVSLKPCNMCKEVIKQARIDKVYYIVDSNFNDERKQAITAQFCGDCKEKYTELLSRFFKKKR